MKATLFNIDFKIDKICGENNSLVTLSDVGNNPNFIFRNDPNFELITLYSADGGKINVNSWVECANYVSGGWTNGIFPTVNYESYFFYFLIFSSLTYSIISNIYKKYAD
jgi:hypothetical protein